MVLMGFFLEHQEYTEIQKLSSSLVCAENYEVKVTVL